jgi:hypothetical protein
MKEIAGEIWIGECRARMDGQNILHETIVGEVNEKIAHEFEKASQMLRKNVVGRMNVLIDLTRAGKPTPKARKLARVRLEDVCIGKVALFGMHPVARVIASFVIGITRKKDMRFFKTKDEALAWLRGEL